MNKKALGLSALGLLLFTAPAFAQDTDKDKPAKTKSEYKESTETGKKGSSYSAEKTTKSGDVVKSTSDEVDKTTKQNAKAGTLPGTGGSESKTRTTKEKAETDSSGNAVKEEKTKN